MNGIAALDVLRIKNFRNLWLSQVISQVALNILTFSLVLRVYELTHSNTAVAMMVLATILPNIFFGALAGVLIDRSDRKVVMFFAHFLRVFAVLAFLLSAESIGWIYILTFLTNVITQFFFPAEASTIHEVVSDRRLLLTANGLFSLTFFGSVIVGNVLAGPALRYLGISWTLVLVAGAFLFASFFTARLPGPEIRKVLSWLATTKKALPAYSATKDEFIAAFMEGLDHIYRSEAVRKGIFIMATGQVLVSVLASIAPGFADKIIQIPVSDVSIYVMLPAATGIILGAIIIGQFLRGVELEKIIKVGITVAAVFLLIFSQVDHVAKIVFMTPAMVSIGVLFILGMANAFLDVPVNTIIQDSTPIEVRSRVYGVISSVIGTVAIFPVVLAGTVADLLGVRMVVILASLAIFLVGIYLHELTRKFDRILRIIDKR